MEGSSSSSTLGRAISPRPMASICCSPPDRVPPYWLRRSLRRGKLLNTRSMLWRISTGSVRVNAPISRFSCTVSGAKILRPSGTWTTPRRTISWAGVLRMDSPRNRMSPERGRNRPEMVFNVVDLPAPFAPIKVTISPSSTLKLIPCKAWMAP